MSLLGPHRPVTGWTAAAEEPDADARHLRTVLQIAAMLVRRERPTHAQGVELCNALDYFRARLEEGRHEAAEVRYALGLPMTAELPEVLAAIRARGGGA